MEGLDYQTESNSDIMSQVMSVKFTMNYFNYNVLRIIHKAQYDGSVVLLQSNWASNSQILPRTESKQLKANTIIHFIFSWVTISLNDILSADILVKNGFCFIFVYVTTNEQTM